MATYWLGTLANSLIQQLQVGGVTFQAYTTNAEGKPIHPGAVVELDEAQVKRVKDALGDLVYRTNVRDSQESRIQRKSREGYEAREGDRPLGEVVFFVEGNPTVEAPKPYAKVSARGGVHTTGVPSHSHPRTSASAPPKAREKKEEDR